MGRWRRTLGVYLSGLSPVRLVARGLRSSTPTPLSAGRCRWRLAGQGWTRVEDGAAVA
uniref:Uncharacterized protein n=1 Tax=Cucumis melo TaxID=3656 RepID=A0A9I9DTX8_CUCME